MLEKLSDREYGRVKRFIAKRGKEGEGRQEQRGQWQPDENGVYMWQIFIFVFVFFHFYFLTALKLIYFFSSVFLLSN